MKTTIKIFTLLAIIFFFGSCGSVKSLPKTDVSEKNQTKVITNDSTEVKVVEKPGAEMEIEKEIPEIKTGDKKCDSICNAQKDDILKSLNQKIKSGKNQLSITYDKYKKTFKAYSKLQSSYDSIVKTKSTKKEYFNITKTITITKTYEKKFSQEQKINLWTGRIFWVLLVLFLGFKLSKTF